jgi:hypothetical protein
MMLELTDIRSTNADFKPPTRRNGEELRLHSVGAQGEYFVVRYFGWEPVEGPAIDRFMIDVYYNHLGSEAFRVTARLIEPPPATPTLLERLLAALQIIFGMQTLDADLGMEPTP